MDGTEPLRDGVVSNLAARVRQLLPKGRFARAVAVLAGGTAIAQVIRVAGTPVLTRIFRPEDYGVLAVYGSIISILAPVGSLRYELAIPLPDDDDTAANLLMLAIGAGFAFAIILGIASIVWGQRMVTVLGAPTLEPYLWLMPLSLAGGSAYSAFNYWAVRKRAFSTIARTRLSQSAGQLLTQIGIGALIPGAFGLLAGDVIGRVAGIGTLATLANRQKSVFHGVSWAGARKALSRYSRFPILSSPSALLNSAGLNVPTLLLAAYYGAQTVGWFALAQRVIAIPATFVGQAVSQVYFGEAARLANSDPQSLRRLFWLTCRKLFLLGLLPTLVLCTAGPWLFATVFGSSWRVAGEYVRLLAPMFLVQFAIVPVSMTANILERQDVQLAWDVARFAIVVGSMAVASAKGVSATNVVLSYSIAMLIAYVVLLYLLSRVLSHHNERTNSEHTVNAKSASVEQASESVCET